MGVPEQPTLRDGDVVLRPWRDEDVDPARLQHDDEIGYWFGFDTVIPTQEQQQAVVDRWRAQYADGRRLASFVVQREDTVVGTVQVHVQDGTGQLSWALYAAHRGRGTGTRALRLLVEYAFVELGLHRVEAYVAPEHRRSLRVASRAGLRREGLLRGRELRDGQHLDTVLMARLADDPGAQTRDGFIAMLNAGLPTKRVISQGVLRDRDGRVLLCELTYKQEWDLPGGVIERHESPATGLRRELAEELGVDLVPGPLVTVNWLPAWRGWDDACVFAFDVGVVDAELVSSMTLQPAEIRAVHWCTREQVSTHAAAATARLLDRIDGATDVTPYLEDAADRSDLPRT